MSNIAYITPDGSLVHIYGLLWSGIYDMGGVPIFEKDRVSVYIPTLDEHREGTVVFRTEDDHPQWLVRLDKPHKHEHHLAAESRLMKPNITTLTGRKPACLSRCTGALRKCVSEIWRSGRGLKRKSQGRRRKTNDEI